MQISRGRPISARAMATICCSPPDSVPARLLDALGDAGEQCQHALVVLRDRGPVAPGERAHQQVLAHRHGAEQPPGLRHGADAAAR